MQSSYQQVNLNSSQYKILKKIGEGSFGNIYSAYDLELKQNIAIKFLKDDSNADKMYWEFAKLLFIDMKSNVNNIVNKIIKPYSIFLFNNDQLAFTMQLKGPNLKKLKEIAPNGKINPVLGIGIITEMFKWISQLHILGVVHWDIKPSNFVVGTEGTEYDITLIDLGSAKFYKTNEVFYEENRHGRFIGCTAYASLNAHNYKDLDCRDDLVSWYFWALEILNEKLKWRYCSGQRNEVKRIKEKWLKEPNLYLWSK